MSFEEKLKGLLGKKPSTYEEFLLTYEELQRKYEKFKIYPNPYQN